MANEEPKDTLYSLSKDLERADLGLVEFNPELHKETLIKFVQKVDRCRHVHQKYRSRIAEIDEDIKELTAIKKTLQANLSAFESHMLWVMKELKTEEMVGEHFNLKLRKTKVIKLKIEEPDAKLYLKLPDLVDRTYKWKKAELNKAYKQNPESLADYAFEDYTESVNFKTKRGLDE